MAIKVGDEIWTPFAPRGRVRVLEIFPRHAFQRESCVMVELLHDHAGYGKGTEGYCLPHELEDANGKEIR